MAEERVKYDEWIVSDDELRERLKAVNTAFGVLCDARDVARRGKLPSDGERYRALCIALDVLSDESSEIEGELAKRAVKKELGPDAPA